MHMHVRSKNTLNNWNYVFVKYQRNNQFIDIGRVKRESSNVLFLGPMEFIGIGESPNKERFFIYYTIDREISIAC
jgi:hypothetical protein